MNVADLDRLAQVAHLEVNEKDKESIVNDMNQLLALLDQLDQIELDATTRLERSEKIDYSTLRDDVPFPSMDREDILEHAPNKEDGYIVVPNVMD